VFSIDADEEISPILSAGLRTIKDTIITPTISGFSMPRCVLYEGRWIRHGDWYPDRLVRLFRNDRARFTGGKVHERLEVEGSIETFAGELYHHSFKNADDHWARCEKYAQLWAETQFEKGKSVGPLASLSHALFRWLRGYVLKRGFLDGRQGLRIANYCAGEVRLKYQLLRKLHRTSGEF